MRELTQREYTTLWGDLHRTPSKFASFLTDYNLKVSKRKQIEFYHGHRGRIEVCIVYLEHLPGHLRDELDLTERESGQPYTNNIIPFTGAYQA